MQNETISKAAPGIPTGMQRLEQDKELTEKPLVDGKNVHNRDRADGRTLEPHRPLALVVDDYELVRHNLRRLLQHSGYRVLVAGSGEEALQVLADNAHVEVLLTDIMMPGIDGVELARRACARTANLTVVFMSALPHKLEQAKLACDTTPGFLQKPFSLSELLETIAASRGSAPRG